MLALPATRQTDRQETKNEGQRREILVDDQDKALDLYTNMHRFEKKTEIRLKEARWVTSHLT